MLASPGETQTMTSAVKGVRRTIRELVDGTIRVVVDVEPADGPAFLALFPSVDMPIAMAPLSINSRHDNGDYVAGLYRSGWFLNQKVLQACGSDDDYLAWVRRQPSAISKQFSEYVNGEGRCEAAHVRHNSGVGIKPPYSAIPLTNGEHADQHQIGHESFCEKHGKPADWFLRQRARYVAQWAHDAICRALGVSSLAESDLAAFREWAGEHDLELP